VVRRTEPGCSTSSNAGVIGALVVGGCPAQGFAVCAPQVLGAGVLPPANFNSRQVPASPLQRHARRRPGSASITRENYRCLPVAEQAQNVSRRSVHGGSAGDVGNHGLQALLQMRRNQHGYGPVWYPGRGGQPTRRSGREVNQVKTPSRSDDAVEAVRLLQASASRRYWPLPLLRRRDPRRCGL